MADRSKRTVRKHGQSKAAAALAQLAELRRTGKKQADLYELKEEEDLYDEVDEDEYAKRIAKEREEGDGMSLEIARRFCKPNRATCSNLADFEKGLKFSF